MKNEQISFALILLTDLALLDVFPPEQQQQQ